MPHSTPIRPGDNSGALFNYIMKKKRMTRDSELAVFLESPKSKISEIRNGHLEIGDTMLVRICEKMGMSIRTAKSMIAEQV